MADTKITALAAITTVAPANDLLPIVDVDDHSMAASGTTKNITVNQILGAGGTATLASATITGNLTVDTNTLFVDSSNDRVGVGTASPAVRFNIADSDNAANGTIRLGVGAIYSQIKMAASSTGATEFTNVGNGVNGAYNFSIDGQNQYKIATSGVFTWFDGAGGTRMTLNATGLGIGAAPELKLRVDGPDEAPATSGSSSTNGAFRIGAVGASTNLCVDAGVSTTGGVYGWFQARSRGNYALNYDIVLNPNGGNVGIGVTPSAKFDVGLTGAGTPRIQFTSASDNPIYQTQRYSGSGSDYLGERLITGGGFFFQSAPAAAVGSQTFTTRMTLDASGRLILLASTTTPATLSTNGQLTFTATSDTNLRFSYRGSDGVTRVANLTLA